MQVARGFDVADNEVVRLCDSGDLVITSDIPLAADVLNKGVNAIGDLFTIKEVNENEKYMCLLWF